MAIKLQIRRDTAAQWTANNTVVLLEGEIGYETDTRNMKVGDGATTWDNLKYQAPYYTAANSGAANTVLSINAGSGRVGIGNASPASTLDVTGQVRVRGTSAYSEPADNVAALNYDSTTGVMTVDARNSGGSTVVAVRTSNSNVGAERLRVASNGNVGIGTNNPQSQVHIEGTAPVIRLKDTTDGNNAYSVIDGNNDDGSVVISADPGGAGKGASTISLAIDNTTRLQATTSGVAITGTTTSSQLLTASEGFTVASGTITVPSNSISGGALTTNSVILAKLGQQSTPVLLGTPSGTSTATNISALTQAQAQTMLGLPTRSLGSVSVVGLQGETTQKNASLAIGAWAQFEFTNFNGLNTMGVALHTWLYLVCRQSSSGSQIAITIQTGVVSQFDIASATGLSPSSGYNFCVCRIA